MSQSYFRQQRKAQKRATLTKPKPKEYRYMIGNWDGSLIEPKIFEADAIKHLRSTLNCHPSPVRQERLFIYEIQLKPLENGELNIVDIWMFVGDKYHPVQMCVKEKIKLAFLEK
jgi:hypothetical protein